MQVHLWLLGFQILAVRCGLESGTDTLTIHIYNAYIHLIKGNKAAAFKLQKPFNLILLSFFICTQTAVNYQLSLRCFLSFVRNGRVGQTNKSRANSVSEDSLLSSIRFFLFRYAIVIGSRFAVPPISIVNVTVIRRSMSSEKKDFGMTFGRLPVHRCFAGCSG